MSASHWSYDHIADIYATDMGRSMPFNDVAWYVAFARQMNGRVLELGCGTGRILLPMVHAGVTAIGIDRSLPMLARLRSDAQAEGITPFVARMDMCKLGFTAPFRCIILAYSLITYLLYETQAVALLRHLRTQLEPDGAIVIDAFIPKTIHGFSDFRPDYERAHRQGMLERSKRITTLAGRWHQVERRYVLRDRQGQLQRVVNTTDIIKPYTVEELHRIARGAGYHVDGCVFDYGSSEPSQDSRFATLSLRSL